MSHAPGLSGTPLRGHCSSAITRASCASSSARPTSRTRRARPAISFGDSMRKTASMLRWILVVFTGSDHSTFDPRLQQVWDGAWGLRSGAALHLLPHLVEAGGGL